MPNARRSFLREFAGISGSFLLLQSCPPIPAPRRRTPVDPPESAEKQDNGKPDANTVVIQRRTQEKELRETAEQLLARVRDLKTELDRTPPGSVFSVTIFKETQEIEKLAKRLKSYARA